MIRTYILEEIKDYGSEVRIPRSAQKKERSETGSNTKQNNLSGDEGSEGKDGEINSADLLSIVKYLKGSIKIEV